MKGEIMLLRNNGRTGTLSLAFGLLVALAVVIAATSARTHAASETAAHAPRTLTLLVGGGQDTTALHGFFPQNLRVRVGDTVTWKHNGDDATADRHVVTFLGGPFPGPKVPLPSGGPGQVMPQRNIPVPGGAKGENMRNPLILFPTRQAGAPIESYDGTTFVTSGEISKNPRKGTPRNETFSLTFTKPGLYRYICIEHHPNMIGTVEVLPATATDVQDQAQINAQAKAEMDSLLAQIETAKKLLQTARSQPGPNGTTIWYVQAGANLSSELRGSDFDFHPKKLTVKTGDTVIWESKDGHNIAFVPSPLIPEGLIAKPQAEGRPIFVVNPKANQSAVPTGVFEPSQYYNSGPIGIRNQRGTSWAMNFDKPGVYEYVCIFHADRGMKGTITVVAR